MKFTDTPVFVATNLMESMIVNSKPTRAEINDTINTLLDGATGLVLAAETAIGNNPVECVDILRTIIRTYNQCKRNFRQEGNFTVAVETLRAE